MYCALVLCASEAQQQYQLRPKVLCAPSMESLPLPPFICTLYLIYVAGAS